MGKRTKCKDKHPHPGHFWAYGGTGYLLAGPSTQMRTWCPGVPDNKESSSERS